MRNRGLIDWALIGVFVGTVGGIFAGESLSPAALPKVAPLSKPASAVCYGGRVIVTSIVIGTESGESDPLLITHVMSCGTDRLPRYDTDQRNLSSLKDGRFEWDVPKPVGDPAPKEGLRRVTITVEDSGRKVRVE